MKRDDDQELWDLLGKASEPTVSPFFARNVLRQIRREPRWREELAQWFSPRRLIPAAAIAVVVLAGGISLKRSAGNKDMTAQGLPETVVQLEEIDYEVVADLDDLLALEEDSLWLDGEISTL